MRFLKRKTERTPNHLAGAIFGGLVGCICGLLMFAAMDSADWQNCAAGGLVVGSAIGARFPLIAQVSLEFFQVFFP